MTIIHAIRRGRPTAANDNQQQNAAALSVRQETVRALRQEGLTIREIADLIELSPASIHNAIHGRPAPRRYPAANDNVCRRSVANNGGASTTSGMVTVSLARVPTLERPEIAPELAVAA